MTTSSRFERAAHGVSHGAGGTVRPRVSVGWLVLMASPVAAANNATVLILDDLGHALGTSAVSASWLATMFGLALAVATPLQAALIRCRGERAALYLGATLIAVGTLLIVLSPWLLLTVVGRIAEGAGGAGLLVLAIGMAGTARRIGAISAGLGAFGAVGPLVGAQLAEAVSWRVALSLLALSLIAVPAVHRYAAKGAVQQERFDAWGAILLLVFTSGAVLLLASRMLIAIAPIAISLGLIIIHVRRRPDGYIPAATIGSGRFVSAAGLTFVLMTAYVTLLFVVPQVIIRRAGWSENAVALGQLIAMLVAALTTFVFTSVAPRFSHLQVRMALVAASFTATFVVVCSSSPLLLLACIGLALFAATSANATQGSLAIDAVPAEQRPTAIGLFTLAYLLGGAFGPALATLIVLR